MVLCGWGPVQASYTEFLNLYPDCVDNESSTIYDPGHWPKDLELPIFPDGGDVELIRYIYSNVVYPDVVDSVVKAKKKGEESKPIGPKAPCWYTLP